MGLIGDYVSKLLGRQPEEAPEHFVNHGSTGTNLYSGMYQEDYLQKFIQMPEGLETYDKMRKSDYQVQMLLSAIKNPILAASWGVEAVDETKDEQEIASFVEFCLFQDISYPDGSKAKTFREFLVEALTSLEFGFALFEPVYKVVMGHPTWGNYIGLRDIAFRSQKTIYEWNLNNNGSIKNVRQMAQGDLAVDVKIDGNQLMVITFKKEGDNYQGTSILRPVYGNWIRKDLYFKLQAMGMERWALGILIGSVPTNAQDDGSQMTLFKKILKNYTSNQNSYIIKPDGFEIDFKTTDFSSEKIEASIEAEDRRMSKSFLAGFLELGMGTGQGGSQSLGKDLSTVFLNGIEIYSETIADAVEQKIVKKLVDAKFGKRKKYPQIKATDVNSKNSKERAEVAALLKNAGLIRDSDQLEDALNKDFSFPIISKEQKERDLLEGKGRLKAVTNNFQLPVEQSKKLAESIKFAEKKNPTLFIKDRAESLRSLMQVELSRRVDSYLTKMSKDLKAESSPAKRRKILEESELLAGRSDYKKKVRLEIAQLAKEATRDVLAEIGNPSIKFDEFKDILKEVPFALRGKLRSSIEAVLGDQDAELKKRMFFVVSQKLETTDSVDALIADMRKAAETYTSGVLTTVATNLASATVNSARNAVFQTPEVFKEIESFIIVNPSPDSAICKELVGRVFSKDEYNNADLPPYHHNCKSTVKAQLVGQKNTLPINPIGLKPTGTPAEIEAILKSKTF